MRAAVRRFDSRSKAAEYGRSLSGTATHRREERCVRRALGVLPPGARVLDLPCGTGRLVPLLLTMGFRVTAADRSQHMLAAARKAQAGVARRPAGLEFEFADVLDTGFPDDAFDGVLCNRLIHHFREAEARRAALRELRRI